MVLYRHSHQNIINPHIKIAKNLRDYKLAWVHEYCGTRICSVITTSQATLPRCHLVQMSRRNRCAWCSLVGKRNDTSLACKGCCSQERPIYFCSPAVRKCFFRAHKCGETRQVVIDNEKVSLQKKRSRTTIITPDKKSRTNVGNFQNPQTLSYL